MYDVVYLGGGAGGYVGAVTSASLGKKVALVEKSNVGGVCVNYGCIPTDAALSEIGFSKYTAGPAFKSPAIIDFSKNLARSKEIAKKTRELAKGVLDALGVEIFEGMGTLIEKGVKVGDKIIEAENVVVATGARYDLSRVANVKPNRVITAENFWDLDSAPGEVVVFQGGSPSIRGIELAQILAESGSEVTVIDENETLFPQFDSELTGVLMSSLQEHGIKFVMGAKGVTVENGVIKYTVDGNPKETPFDGIIPSHSWLPNTEGLNLEKLGAELHNGFVRVDEKCRTNLPWLYAVGEVTSVKGATRAMYMGRVAALNMAGREAKVNQSMLPSGIYTVPQFAEVGLSEESARKLYGDVVIGRSDITFNEKAMALGYAQGLVKLIFNTKGKLLGGGLVSYDAEELIADIGLALKLEATASDLAFSGYEHATISEAIQDAALRALASLPRDLCGLDHRLGCRSPR